MTQEKLKEVNEKNSSTEANDKSVTSQYTRTYTSFSGADMVAIADVIIPNEKGELQKVTRVMGELMTISYSIHMDKVPVRSLGSVNAKDYVFGPRTIAGSMIFSQFNRHIAHDFLIEANKAAGGKNKMLVMDEMPPMAITIVMANEYGQKARMALYDVRFINEGVVMSVNDVYTENTYQFVATDIEYLTDSQGEESSGMSNARTYFEERLITITKEEGAAPLAELPSGYYENDDFIIEIEDVENEISLADRIGLGDYTMLGNNPGESIPVVYEKGDK